MTNGCESFNFIQWLPTAPQIRPWLIKGKVKAWSITTQFWQLFNVSCTAYFGPLRPPSCNCICKNILWELYITPHYIFKYPMMALYRRIPSTKSPSFCVTTFCASLTNLTDHFLSHIIVAATSADKFLHLHCSDCRNTMIHTHTHTHTQNFAHSPHKRH
jgi:hypothetical protein